METNDSTTHWVMNSNSTKGVSSTSLTESEKWMFVAIFVILAVIVFILLLSMVIVIFMLCCKGGATLRSKRKLNLKKSSKPDETKEKSALDKEFQNPESVDGVSKVESGMFSVKSDLDSSKPIPVSPRETASDISLDERPTDLKV